MKITPQDQQAILQLIERGVEASSSKLAAISGTEWQIRTTSLKACTEPQDYEKLGQPGQYVFGAHCQAPGKMCLALFPERSAALLARTFLAGSGKGLDTTPQMQELAVAEVSNIVINAAAGAVADRCGMAFILSAPKSVRGARAEVIKAAFGDFKPFGKIFSAYIHLASHELAADCTLMLMLDDLIVNFILSTVDR